MQAVDEAFCCVIATVQDPAKGACDFAVAPTRFRFSDLPKESVPGFLAVIHYALAHETENDGEHFGVAIP